MYRLLNRVVVLALWLTPGGPWVEECPAQDPDGYPRAMQGPVLGDVTAESFRVWARMSWTFPVQVAYSTDRDFSHEQVTPAIVPSKQSDYCVTIPVAGLAANTTYYYKLIINRGGDKYLGDRPPFEVRTAPQSGTPVRFRVAFGSCARYQQQPRQPIWDVITAYDPNLFFWLGDNVYADSLDPDILAEELMRQRELPSMQRFLAETAQFAIWDDHDFGLNNHDRTNPQKAENLAVWKRSWPNPGFGLPATEGVFFKYSYGGVDFFFLDGRYHRDPNELPDGPAKTMLGAEQLAWLKSELKASSAAFRVLVSGGIWTADKGPGGDAWSSYRHERDELFDWIMDEQVSGVVLLSGDTHTGELNAERWSERRRAQGKTGYDLYDFVSSPLAQEPDDDWLFRSVDQRIRLPYDRGANFGVIDFDLTDDQPNLTFRLIGLEYEPVWIPLVLNASDLTNGQTTWNKLQTPDARKWMQLQESRSPARGRATSNDAQ